MCPVAEDAYERLISLPMFHAMTAEDVADVARAVHKVIGHYAIEREPAHALASRGSEQRHV